MLLNSPLRTILSAAAGVCRYGILVLVVEMLGATTTLLYGLNILFDPVHEKLPMDPNNPGLTVVRLAPSIFPS